MLVDIHCIEREREREREILPNNYLVFQTALKIVSIVVLKGSDLLAVLNELAPEQPIRAHRAQSNRLSHHHQPLLGPSHCRVEQLQHTIYTQRYRVAKRMTHTQVAIVQE